MKPVVFVCTTPEEKAEELSSLVEILERMNTEVHVCRDFCHPEGQRVIRKNIAQGKKPVLICKRRLARDVFEHNFPPGMEYASYSINGDAAALAGSILADAEQSQSKKPAGAAARQKALVIGGGVAGVYAALDIAEQGFGVALVESDPSIGGIMAALDKTFPTMDCSI